MNENFSQEKVSNENVDFDDEKINNEDVNVNNENVNISNENENENVMNDNNEQFIPPLDIYDPTNDGFNDWKHLFDRLKEHENSSQHLFCMDSWDELIARFDKNKTIDKDLQNKVLTEKERWRQVLKRIIVVIKYLAKYNLAFRGCNEKLFQESNGNFLGAIQMMAEFNVIMQEHVENTSGLGLFNELLNAIKSYGLNIDDVRGQGYDNGSNMKGKHQGVQKRLLEINPKALFMPCDCHSLNLTVSDMAHSCAKSISFFGVLQRIFVLFSSSTKRWSILLDKVPNLTVKSLSNTRWESRIKSVKAIRFQTPHIRDALIELSSSCDDAKSKSEAESLVNAIESYDFLLGYAISIDNAKAIASDMEVEPIFPKKRQVTRKKQFDEINCEDELLSLEESFRIEYFIYIVDVAIASLESRFEQLTNFENIFGFLYDSKRLKSLDDIELKKSCAVFVNKFTHNNLCDVDLNEFLTELKVLQKTLPNVVMSSVEILEFVKGKDCYPNVCIAYRILLTVPVTVVSAERNFSKLKLLKNYLRSSMSQERLNGLAMLCIEKDLLDNIELDSIIDDFASKKARKCKFL
ncbi:uncharacterized protein LOC111891056 [Lactuca sativa]|uniref:uncharacterized protein LOC111891056 n=1 Tax=Lactuca sativa TaxID=4236 RepID=UPI0022B00678|nr:uncharacterized protein LOC111891056 [Lactuca sativa]